MTLPARWWLMFGLCLVLAACAAPTPIAQVALTVEPTATAVPPTNTSAPTNTPEPTATTVPTATSTAAPTNTPQPTATTVPTQPATATKAPTKVATSAATKAPTKPATAQPPASGGNIPISAIPANAPLNAAVQRSFQTAQGILGELNNVLAGRSSKCSDLMAMYNLFVSAPTYDVSKQSTNVQTAYGLYRQGVDAINSTAPKVRRICEGQGGGNIDKLDLQEAQKSVSQTVGLFGHASDLLPPVTATVPAPIAAVTATPVVSSIALSDLLLQTMDRMHVAGGHLDGAQTNLTPGFCEQFKPLYQTIITVVGLNESGRDPTWIDSYGAYKAALAYFQNKLYRAIEVCNAGGGTISNSEFGDMRRAVDAAAIAVARAYDQLRNKNLLGQ